MNRSVFALTLPVVALLLLGVGSCASRGATTVSPEPAVTESSALASEHTLTCEPGTADCDRDAANGCEVTLADDPTNCGVCGVQCDRPQAETGCIGGTCRMIQCEPHFADADHDPQNGCEAAIPRERP